MRVLFGTVLDPDWKRFGIISDKNLTLLGMPQVVRYTPKKRKMSILVT